MKDAPNNDSPSPRGEGRGEGGTFPPRNRMLKRRQLRTRATTRDVIGRDPGREIIAGYTGPIEHHTRD